VSTGRVIESTLEFPYTRTLGPVIGGFLNGLRERRLLGIATPGGRVLVPPLEYDPDTGAALGVDLVEVGPLATVSSWTWVAQPTSKHPLDRPFAFALLTPDGADTAMVHAVDAGAMERMSTGMKVSPRWREERKGMIDDIECWEPAS
jgi:uncharacterized OB-fold protein